MAQTYATQRAAIEQAATARGDAITAWFSEKRTGAELARPELDGVRALARAGKLSRLYVMRPKTGPVMTHFMELVVLEQRSSLRDPSV